MRNLLVALAILLGSTAAMAQFSVGVLVSGVSIGINLPVYPELVRVPGYPVYYAPRANSNYFFYDGYYWVFAGNNWYVSEWYNGPWQWVGPEQVPLFMLRVPVGYYRVPPPYFRGWNIGEPPRWGEHWGRDWEARHGGWQRWDRRSAPPPAPLPRYQERFSGDRYPHRPDEQHAIHSDNYRYQPRESARPEYPGQPGQRQFAPPERHEDAYGRRDERNDRREDAPSPAWQRPQPAPQYLPPPRQEPPAAPPALQMQPPPMPPQQMPPQRQQQMQQQMQGGPAPWGRGEANERPREERLLPREVPHVERGNDAARETGREMRQDAGREAGREMRQDAGREAGREVLRDSGRENRNDARRGDERRPDERRGGDRRGEAR